MQQGRFAAGIGVAGLVGLLIAAVAVASAASGIVAGWISSIVFPRSATHGGEHARFAETLNELIRKSRYEAAIDVCKKVAAARPDDPTPYVNMIEIAAYRLRDRQRVDALYRRGQQLLRSPRSRRQLDASYEFVLGAL